MTHAPAACNTIVSEYMSKILNKILCGFCKAHSTQRALFRLLQAWQTELDNSGKVGTILMDLGKVYDCIPHDLLIAKLEAYGLDKISLDLLFDCLNNSKQRSKISSSFRSWYDIITEIPLGSILTYSSMTYFFSRSNQKYVVLLMTTSSTVAIEN